MVNVTVYSAPNCPWCDMAKQFLKNNKIRFREIDVSEDGDSAKDMAMKSGQMGVPVIDVDGKILVGFNEAKLKKLLKLK